MDSLFERQKPFYQAWWDKREANQMTISEYCAGPDFSSLKDKVTEVEAKLDKEREPEYEQRDSEINRLRTTFMLELIGAKPTDLFQDVDELELEKDPPETYKIGEDEYTSASISIPYQIKSSSQIEGWQIYEGEEVTVVFFNGEQRGRFTTSCRGGMYFADADLCDGRTFSASDKTAGLFRK